jgi:hypothetical protein
MVGGSVSSYGMRQTRRRSLPATGTATRLFCVTVRGIRSGSSEESIINHAHTSATRTAGTTTSLLGETLSGVRRSEGEDGIIGHAYTSTAVATTTTAYGGQSRSGRGRGRRLRRSKRPPRGLLGRGRGGGRRRSSWVHDYLYPTLNNGYPLLGAVRMAIAPPGGSYI